MSSSVESMPSFAGRAGRLSLTTVSGPTTVSMTFDPAQKQTYGIGRRPGQDVQLTDPASRDHAMLMCDRDSRGVQWYLIDTRSKNGTLLNGVQLVPDRRYPVRPGDLIQITHWTLRISDPDAMPKHSDDVTIVRMVDDAASTGGTISEIESRPDSDIARQRLALLLECARSIHQAQDEKQLAEAAIEALIVGTGYPNAAFLRPLGGDESIDVVCSRGAALSDKTNPQISRSLVKRAQEGKPYRLTRGQDYSSIYHSIAELGIDEALCVPILLAGMTTGFLYLDSRGESGYRPERTENAADFAVCIAQLAAMATANLMRLDLERRKARIDAELETTGEAQRLILPARRAVIGPFEYIGESRPGRVVSGDFFDVIPLDKHRVAITLGDVVGKGMAASVLMTVAVGYLRAALMRYGDPGDAVSSLNEYLQPRCGDGRFITLWAAVIDGAKRELAYVDAGHGYAFLIEGDSPSDCRQLNEGVGMPIGILPDSKYASASSRFEPGQRAFVVSDGIVEQAASSADSRADRGAQFGAEAACKVVCQASAPADPVQVLFRELVRHAGAEQLDDDATVLLVQYDAKQ